jgi:hypothetical protein
MSRVPELKVVHDFDNAFPSGRWALKRGLQLVLYALSRKIGFLKRFCEEVYCENYDYAITFRRLDMLLGINAFYGIHNRILPDHPQIKEELQKMGAHVRDHHHDVNEVTYSPSLPFEVPRSQWWFDLEYSQGKRGVNPDEVIEFHCEHPYLLAHYIRCVYEARKLSEGAGSPR